MSGGSPESVFSGWTSLELAGGWRFGGNVVSLGRVAGSPREVIEAEVRQALTRPPCLVAFSGGRDSSAILAVATHVARRDGLQQPIPVTRVYPGLDEADEGHWPERVIRHLGLKDWDRIIIREQLDAIGPLAGPLVRRFGPLWPPVAHSIIPVLERARGGAVLTGEGGDNVFGPQPGSTLRRMLARRQPVNRAAVAGLWRSYAPARWRRRALEQVHRGSDRADWMTPRALEDFVDLQTADELRQPRSWAGAMGWQLGSRAWVAGYRLLAAIADEHDVVLRHPLAMRSLAASLAPQAGRLGFLGRATIMIEVFGDLLPYDVLRRADKASFNASVFGDRAREFAESWDGTASFADHVDVAAMRAGWLASAPHPALISGLQAAWLESRPG